MRIDMHCHVMGKGKSFGNADNEIFFKPEDNNTIFTKYLYKMLEKSLVDLGGDKNQNHEIDSGEYFDLLYNLLLNSKEIDGIVLLAMDAVYSPKTGEPDLVKTDLYVTNRFLSKKVEELNAELMGSGSGKKFFFGASVNPNRKDWEMELNYVLTQTDAVLVKLIPSAQHIRINDIRHREYWKTLSRYGMPLLCHVGPEYAFPEGIRMKQYDNFRFLERPLDNGVTVIAAHCATPVIPFYDKNETKEFLKFMKSANSGGRVRLYGDTSALSMATRIHLLPELVDCFPPEWLVNGSDFPIPVDAWPHLPYITNDIDYDEYKVFMKTTNPFDLDVRIKRACGFSDTILTNAVNVLRGIG